MTNAFQYFTKKLMTSPGSSIEGRSLGPAASDPFFQEVRGFLVPFFN